MSLDEVVNLTILTLTETPSQESFSVPLIMAYHEVTPEGLTSYSSLREMVDAGFKSWDPAYRCAQSVFSQNPRPARVYIGKRTNPYTQTIELSPTITTVGYTYTFEVVDALGVVSAITYQVQSGDSVNSICVELQTQIDAVAEGSAAVSPAAPNATKVVWTSSIGKLANFRKLPRPSYLKVQDVTVDPGITADLTAVEAFDSTEWYGITFDHVSKASIEAIAAWVETRRKIAVVNVVDYEAIDGSTSSDIASVLKGQSRVRTELLYSGVELLSYSAAAWLGVMLPKTPGSATWAYKTLRGISPDTLTSAQKAAAKTKRLNTYTIVGSLAKTQWGQSPDAGYTDIVVGADALYATIQRSIFGVLASSDKTPFTDGGIDSIRNVLNGVLETFSEAPYNFIVPGSSAITIPKAADVSAEDRANRHLPNVNWSGRLSGAIHTVDSTGLLSV